MLHALLVEDDEKLIQPLTQLTQKQGFASRCARTLKEARSMLQEERTHVLLLDTSLPDGDGLDLLEEGRKNGSWDEVIVMSDTREGVEMVMNLREPVRDCIRKPFDLTQVQSHLEVISRGEETGETVESFTAGGDFGPMIGRSPAMTDLYRMTARVAPTDATVLLIGESGTGKELIAQTLHERSRRRNGRFVPINCGAIPENLIESELFGHERGAFTGANQTRKGVFERACRGTLLLDEVTEMPMDLQTRLLRVLETQRVTRVGGEKEIETDVRVIAATNRNPADAVAEGKLREDLLYRLSVFPLQVPPLKERERDIELLAHHFLAKLNEQTGVKKRFHPDAIQHLKSYHWPGNVRQLRNVVHRAHILSDEVVDASSFPLPTGRPTQNGRDELRFSVGTSLAEAEKDLIYATLQHYQGDKRRTAKTLGVSLKTLYNRLNSYKAEACSGNGV